MRYLIQTLVPLALLSAPVTGLASPDLTAETDRISYQLGEPVWLYVDIHNPTSHTMHVENPACSRAQTTIELEDAGGRVFHLSGPPSCATTILEEIPPGGSMLYAFELLEHYGVDGGGEYPFGFLPAGEYAVRYRSDLAASPTARFQVHPPGEADIGAFHDYVDLLAGTGGANLRGSLDRFRTFVRHNPGSPFAPPLLCRAGVVSDLFFDSRQAREDFESLIRLYPESGYVSVAIRHLAFGMSRDRAAGQAFLRGLPDEMPGTLAARIARRVVDRLDAGSPDPES